MKQEPRKHSAAHVQPLLLYGILCAALHVCNYKLVCICCPESGAAVLTLTTAGDRTRDKHALGLLASFLWPKCEQVTPAVCPSQGCLSASLSIYRLCSRATARGQPELGAGGKEVIQAPKGRMVRMGGDPPLLAE